MSDSDATSSETNESLSSSSSDSAGGGPESSGDGSSEDKNALEWAITIVGAALVLFAFGYFVYSWITMPDEQKAELVIEMKEPSTVGGIVEIPVEVRNEGARVAEAAVVEVCAGPDSCAQLTFDFVPFKSTVKGRVGLSAPLQQPLTSRMVSYREP